MNTTASPDTNAASLHPWPSIDTCDWMREHGFEPRLPAQTGKHEDTALILACRQGKVEVVTDLLMQPDRIALDHRNMDGTNALWASIVSNAFEIADMLLRAGIDLDNVNENGATALMYASSAGKHHWVKYLLEHGAQTDGETPEGFTALDLASNIECLRLLRAVQKANSAAG